MFSPWRKTIFLFNIAEIRLRAPIEADYDRHVVVVRRVKQARRKPNREYR